MEVLGIDIGGSGIKGAPVDVDTGVLLAERFRVDTPKLSTPVAVADAVRDLVNHFSWSGPVGCGFPGIVLNGATVHSAANVDSSWINVDAARLFCEATDCPVTMSNDADAAGIAEMTHGAGQDANGVVFVITLGTGIGTALFTDGVLVPNVELGHLKIRGKVAEKWTSAAVRKSAKLSWKQWSARLTEYFAELEAMFSPSLFIVGGGVSRKSHKFLPRIAIETDMTPALMQNNAGIIGAAMAAATASPSATPQDDTERQTG
jgi:polyphosphate glucokinase